MQLCVKSEIVVLRKEAVNVFKIVIYIRIGKWPMDDHDRIDFVINPQNKSLAPWALQFKRYRRIISAIKM